MTIALGADASKAVSTPFAHTQPDGTTLMVRLMGDEHLSWYQTMDGVLLECVDKDFFVAKVEADGTLSSTGTLAHNLDSRSADEQTLCLSQDKELFFSDQTASAKARRKAISGYPSSTYCPHAGTIHIPVILMQYPDKPFVLTNDDFETYFHGTDRQPYSSETRFLGYSSVHEYFKDASFGQFDVQFDVYGPYTTAQKHDYYGNSSNSSGSRMMTEAIKAADGDIDFSQYDSNNDGYVDLTYIFYSGCGANIGGDNSNIWPKCSYAQNISTQDSKKIRVIGLSNELVVENYTQADGTVVPLRAGIGVFCHELSHGLGLPDLYHDFKDSSKQNNCGPEMWDLMDGGENLFNGMWPTHYAAWERDIMGWMDLDVLSEPQDVTVYPLNDSEGRGKAYRINNPEDTKEYYVVENILADEWHSYLKARMGTGLIITHVNDISTKGMTPNATYGHPNLTILPADDLILSYYLVGDSVEYKDSVQEITSAMYYEDLKGDPYPGPNNVTSLSMYKNYSGSADMMEQYPITDITANDDGSISFKFMGGGKSTGITAVNVQNSDNKIYTPDGRCLGTDSSALSHGIYIRGGKKFVK